METLELQRRRAAQRENDAVACCRPSMSSSTAARTSACVDSLMRGKVSVSEGAAWVSSVRAGRRCHITPLRLKGSILPPPPSCAA